MERPSIDSIGLFVVSIIVWKVRHSSTKNILRHCSSSSECKVKPDKNPNKVKHVAIIGSGVGGLGAAVALQKRGIACTVYERDQKFEDRRQGYGMTLSSSDSGPLAKLGILDACLAADCASYCHWVFTPSGKIIGYYGRAFKDTNFLTTPTDLGHNDINRKRGGGNLRIPREHLRRLLLNELAPHTVQWGKKFKSCHPNTSLSVCNSSDEEKCPLEVAFEDGTVITTDLLVGADGLKSAVRSSRTNSWVVNHHSQQQTTATTHLQSPPSLLRDSSPLKYLGVTVIIGISSCTHPLLVERGFYVVDGVHRLFTMPFAVSKADEPDSKPLCMWQLSFSGLSEGEGILLKRSGPDAQLAEARHRTAGWMSPVSEMLHMSDPKEVWATPLYDRSPMSLPPPRRKKRFTEREKHKKIGNRGSGEMQGDNISQSTSTDTARSDAVPNMGCSSEEANTKAASMGVGMTTDDVTDIAGRITVLGDACHPMSMFKGQGANQALQDGPLLASWLEKTGKQASLDVAGRVVQFEREMVSRTSPRVQASYEASQMLHSPQVFAQEFGIEGLSSEESVSLLRALDEKLVRADLLNEEQVKDEVGNDQSGMGGRRKCCKLELRMLAVWSEIGSTKAGI